MTRMAKKILTMVLAGAMVLSMGVSAFAEDGETTAAAKYDLSKAKMTKDLEVADGIDISSVKTFDFSFTADESTTAAKKDHPGIAAQQITVKAQSGGHAYGSLAMSDVFNDVTKFPHAGEYVYKVEETTTGTDNLTVDTSEYTVHIYVANNGTGLKFDGITVEKDGEKVDPTKEGNTTGFNFDNKYKEEIEDTENGALTIKKTIDGAYGDKTKEFPITVTLTLPSLATKNDVAVAEGEIKGEAPTLTVSANLANNGTIKFTKLPAGTTFKVEEDQDAEYTGRVSGDLVETKEFAKGAAVSATSAGPVVEAGKTVTLTNTRENVIPTGVIINNLPYMLMVAIAVAGVAYMQLKKRI